MIIFAAFLRRTCLVQEIITRHISVFVQHPYHFRRTPLNNFLMYSQVASDVPKVGLLERLKAKYVTASSKKQAEMSGSSAYEKCADDIDYIALIKSFQLPDTFFSWFLLIQLHVWMCIARTGVKGQGRCYRNKIIEAMWQDVETRIGKLENITHKQKKRNLKDMNEQFRASLISYDEGYNGDDTALASSVWRTLYGFKCEDPVLLEMAVLYIRKQVSHLDSQDFSSFLHHGNVDWLPLKDIFKDTHFV